MLKNPQGKLLFDPPDYIELNSRISKRSDFEFIKKLGDGSYSQVWKVKHIKTRQFFAIKQVPKSKVLQTLNQFRREVEILYKFYHPHIIKLFTHFEDDKFFYLIMELMEGGTLFHKLYSEKKFKENVAAQFFREVVLAVEFLHTQSPPIVHRDIKPENIMIDKDMRVKLIDFGWANFINASEKRYTYCGTSEYMPPEIISNQGHTLSCDIWCLGILLYEMLIGHTPFKSTEKTNLDKMIKESKIKFFGKLNLKAKNFIGRLLDKDPNTRATIAEVKHSEWLQGIPAIRKTIKQDNIDRKPVKIDYTFESNDTNSSDSECEFRKIYLKKHRKSDEKLKETIMKENFEILGLRKKIDAVSEEAEFESEKLACVERMILNKKKEMQSISNSSNEMMSKIFDSNLELEKMKGENLNKLYELRAETQEKLLESTKECKINKKILENLRKKVGKESILFATYEIQLQKLQLSYKNLQNLSHYEENGVQSCEKSLVDQIGLFKLELSRRLRGFSNFSLSDEQQASEICELINTNLSKNSEFSTEIQKKLEHAEVKAQDLENSIQELRIVYQLDKCSVLQNFQMQKSKILQKFKTLGDKAQEESKKNELLEKEKLKIEAESVEKAELFDISEVNKARKRVEVRNI